MQLDARIINGNQLFFSEMFTDSNANVQYCCRKSSVCPPVTLRYRGRVSWVTSKIITQIHTFILHNIT